MTLEEAKNYALERWEVLKEIPNNEFITGTYTNEVDKCCVIGHEQRLKSNPNDYAGFNCSDHFEGHFRNCTALLCNHLGFEYWGISSINNKQSKYFPQKTIKGRLRAFFRMVEKIEV